MRVKFFDEVIRQVTTRFALRYENNFARLTRKAATRGLLLFIAHLSSRTNLRSTSDFQDFFRLMTIHIDLFRSRINKYNFPLVDNFPPSPGITLKFLVSFLIASTIFRYLVEFLH